ncbi:MAG: cation-translocating P-type ATPase [Planctomycetaceae bacterium]
MLMIEGNIHGTNSGDQRNCQESVQAECAWCSLPVAGVAPSDPSSNESIYCCYGCRFAHAVTEEKGDEGAIRWTVVRLGIAVFFTMNLMAFTMTMWSLDVYDVKVDPFQQKLFEVFRWLSMLFGLPVLMLLGWPLLQGALASWKQKIYSTDLLVATGVASAFGISVFNVLTGRPNVYFEVGAMVLVAVTLGRWLEATGKQKATEVLDQLSAMLPAKARLLTSDRSRESGREEEVDSASLQVGHHIRVAAGDRFPADGRVVSGHTTVDEQIFTGESRPVGREPGDSVLAGTVNLEGDVIVECSCAFREGSFGRLLKLMQEARAARGPYQKLADRASMWFFPAISLLSLVTLILHWKTDVGQAVQHSLSVLLIACPCALGLATPLAVWTSLSTAIRNQVLFRSGESIERLATAGSVFLDKTGTLTTGQPRVVHVLNRETINQPLFTNPDPAETDFICALLSARSMHPFSKAVTQYLASHSMTPRFALSACGTAAESSQDGITDVIHSVRTFSGRGVEALDQHGHRLRLGSLSFATSGTESPLSALASRNADQLAASVVAFSVDDELLRVFLINESIREEAVEGLSSLYTMGLPVTVLTGDRKTRADALAQELAGHLGKKNAVSILSELRPQDKVAAIQSDRQSQGSTVMIGDGINDAPALAVADVGIAMGCGADVSRESAQVCLLSNDLRRIAWAIQLARLTRRIIRQNLFWAFGYNAVGVVLAVFGLLNPAFAAALMIISSLLVISNSLRLMAFDGSGSIHHA